MTTNNCKAVDYSSGCIFFFHLISISTPRDSGYCLPFHRLETAGGHLDCEVTKAIDLKLRSTSFLSSSQHWVLDSWGHLSSPSPWSIGFQGKDFYSDLGSPCSTASCSSCSWVSSTSLGPWCPQAMHILCHPLGRVCLWTEVGLFCLFLWVRLRNHPDLTAWLGRCQG